MSHYTIHQDDDTSTPVHEYRWSLLKDGKTIGEFFTQSDAETIRAALNGEVRGPVVTDSVAKSAALFKKLFVPVTYEPWPDDTLAVRMCKKIYNLVALARFHGTPIGSDELRTISSAAFAGLEGEDEEVK